MTIDGPFLLGIAGIITALFGGAELLRRGVNKQRGGVPVREDELDRDLLRDRAKLLKQLDEARDEIDRMQHEISDLDVRRRTELDAAESRRTGEARIYQSKVDELVRARNHLADVSARNRRRFVEKFGEEALVGFEPAGPLEDTWTPEDLQAFRDAGNV